MTRASNNGSGTHVPGEPDALRALARAVERCQRHMERLDGRLDSLADAVAELHATPSTTPVNGLAHDLNAELDGPGVRSWLLANDRAQAAADLDDLASWVWRVFLWFPKTRLTSCWLWHPAVIEELWCLRVAHADAFDPKSGSVLRVADWHERLRPGVTARVGEELRVCELVKHIPWRGRPVEVVPPARPPVVDAAPAVAAVWTAGAGLDVERASGPDPTREQLAEAEVLIRQGGRR